MQLKKIKLKNIRSYQEEEIEFVKGSTLLSGDIGSGKTTILLAIEFALFGLQPGQKGTSLLRNGEEDGEVKIEFEVDNKEIIIERKLKKGKTITQDYSAITIDGKKDEISVTELKNTVLELLNYPKEFSKKQNILYKFTVYTPQEEMKQIILQDSETRINTLRHVFGIDKYKQILENTSIIMTNIREEKRVREGITMSLEQDKTNVIKKEQELKSIQRELIFLSGELLLKIEKRKDVEKEKDEIYKKIEEKNKLKQEIEKTRIIINNKEEILYNNSKLNQELITQLEELKSLQFDESQIQQLENEIKSKREQKEKLNNHQLEINSKINSINYKNQDHKNLIQTMSNLKNCPTCLQNVDAIYRANVLNKANSDIVENNKKIGFLEQEKKEILKQNKILEEEIHFKERKITDLKILKMKLQDIDKKEKKLHEIEISKNSLNQDLIILKKHLETLNNSIFELVKYDGKFNAKQIELQEAFREEKIAEIKIAETKKEINMHDKQIEELKERVKKIEEIKKQLNYLIELETWFSKKFIPLITYIERNVMIKLKTEFSKLFAEWFNMLVSDTFNVRLRDDFTPIIEQQDYEIDYAFLSGGERTAIALAYRLSLNQVINSLLSKIKTKDLVILDEPTDGFSEQQLDKMRDVLQQLKIGQLIIVSHEQKIESFVENVIRFKKDHGISIRE
ncbi:MAG: SMC protein [archaeon GW2011_AR13]|nr:MAG: SMC protein [archaeon GW2011_AR13]HIG94485.1 AAA family ATPase [Nanoarchaeota archaeon]HIH62995.1 AAA family ATPase [Nanoarchaeota archaeon]HIJ10260.1 AAA family ATPase [Nanoarchaeota archaeon]